jgi:nitrite reductase/ring-hydroxylating ferredoxin subunit
MTMEAVAAFDELEEGVPFVATAGRRKVVLTRWLDTVYALKDVCPHQSVSFLGGRTAPRVVASAPGAVECIRTSPLIICPWHAWRFDLETGDCTTSSKFRVKSYPAEVRDGTVYVDFERGASRRRAADDVNAAEVADAEPVGA